MRAKHRTRRLKQFITRYSADAYSAASSALGPFILGGSLVDTLATTLLLSKGERSHMVLRMSRIAIAAGLVAACALLVLPNASSPAITMVAVGIAIVGASAVSPLIVGPAQLLVRNQDRAKVQAITSFCFTLVAGGLGPSLVGLASDHLYSDPSALAQSITLICSTSAALGVILLLIAERSLRNELQRDPTTPQ